LERAISCWRAGTSDITPMYLILDRLMLKDPSSATSKNVHRTSPGRGLGAWLEVEPSRLFEYFRSARPGPG
jgi:hypothetical protein